jgi:hypothetical protein
MNDERLDKLFQAARRAKPDTSRAEYGFETRLLAALRSKQGKPLPWFAFAWKLMPVFAAVVLALGVWTIMETGSGSSDLQSAITGDQQDTTLVSLTGESQ